MKGEAAPLASPDARRVVTSRALRGFVDGLVSIVLPSYLLHAGFRAAEVGALVTATLVGSAALTIAIGLAAHRFRPERVLLAACGLMAATGLVFAAAPPFAILLIAAVLGTLNPSGADVSIFLPTEQAVLADATAARSRAGAFAWYNVVGAVGAALGALAAAYPEALSRHGLLTVAAGERSAFLLYAATAVVVALVYAGLRRHAVTASPRAPLSRSRGHVLRLAALFSLDSFGGGFVVQSLLVLWLQRRFGFSAAAIGALFFASSLLNGASQFVAARVAARLGPIPTMVYTHLPANVCLALAGIVPHPTAAVVLLLIRASLSSMDVPVRQAYVMALVPPGERAAAAGVTNVPRSLAAALPPLLVGFGLEHSVFGWPLVVAGVLKALYDVLLWIQFSRVPVPVEDSSAAS